MNGEKNILLGIFLMGIMPWLGSCATPQSISTIPPGSTLTFTARPFPTAIFTVSPSPDLAPEASQTPTDAAISEPETQILVNDWEAWPVIPELTVRVGEIYLTGKSMGNDSNVFTRVGDCQSVPEFFLGVYDTTRYEFPPDYAYLQETIEKFRGSFTQPNVTAHDGFSVHAVLSPLYADPQYCRSGENPLECEYRLRKPSIAFISLGDKWESGAEEKFEASLRQNVEFWLNHGVVPVLMTKADDPGGENSFNRSIVQVASEYDVPLLNIWAAVQQLPNQGMHPDSAALTAEAWDMRSFNALMMLDLLWKTFGG